MTAGFLDTQFNMLGITDLPAIKYLATHSPYPPAGWQQWKQDTTLLIGSSLKALQPSGSGEVSFAALSRLKDIKWVPVPHFA